MANIYTAGEKKVRPGTYYRYTNIGTSQDAGAMNGICAIVIQASWGPSGVVTLHDTSQSIKETYGTGAGVDAAAMLKTAGAQRVYVYRIPGGTAANAILGEAVKVTAKHPGTRALIVKVQAKPGDATKKQVLVIEGTTQLEKFEFAASQTDETAAMIAAVENSEYITIEVVEAGIVPATEVELKNGADPTVKAENYLAGFQALESYGFNTLSTDSEEIDVAVLLSTYANEVSQTGKNFIAVVGAPTTTDFETRKTNAKSFNDHRVVYFGSGFVMSTGEKINGALAISYTAGMIAATPANESIVHSVVKNAVDLTERLTNAEYEDAIKCGLLLLSAGPDGQIWFDSGVNTLTTLAATQDEGWKKIKRTKVRFELFDRIDKVTAPLVGKVNCDADGIAAVIQAGMGVIKNMVAEKKVFDTTVMIVDPDNPYAGDSAWFLIQTDDIDSLEKIYLHYQFRYSQHA